MIFGDNSPNTLGLVRSVGESGYDVYLLLHEKKQKRCFVSCSRYVKAYFSVKCLKDSLLILHDVLDEGGQAPVLLCSNDHIMSFLDDHYDALRRSFVVFNAKGEQGRISHFMDKREMLKLASECGLNTIKTWSLRGGDPIPDNIIFPCITKAVDSIVGSKADLVVCNNIVDLSMHLKDGMEYLVQEYIKKDYEINVNGVSLGHGTTIVMPGAIRKIRETLARQSDFIVLEQLPKGLDLDLVSRFIAEIGYEGLFSIEFLCKGDVFYLLEINMRNDGVSYLYTRAGWNLPEIWIRYMSGETDCKSDKRDPVFKQYYLMTLGDVFNFREGKVGFWDWLKDICKTDVHLVLNLKDPLPFIALILGIVRNKTRRLLGLL